jgi:hypothetical protein
MPETIRPVDELALGCYCLVPYLTAKAVKWQLQKNLSISSPVLLGFCECRQMQKKETWKAIITEFL